MRLNLVQHPDGGFALSMPERATNSLQVTDPIYDGAGWWHRDLAVLVLARFDDGDVQQMHYHPGRTGSILHCIYDFGDLLARVGLIALLAKTAKKPSGTARSVNDSATVAKSAVYTFRDSSHMSNHFSDGRKYPNEGYYIGEELIIRGKITRRHFT